MKQLLYITLATATLTITTADAQNIFVANWNHGNVGGGTISVFDSSGDLLNGAFASGLSQPWGMAFDSTGNLYVANPAAGTVSKFDANGSLVNMISVPLFYPLGLAVDRNDNLYVGESYAGKIMEFNSSGNLVNGSFASGLGQPSALAFDDGGNLYVATFGTVAKFNSSGTLINGSFVTRPVRPVRPRL